MTQRLYVHYGSLLVGEIELNRAGRMRFDYSHSWLSQKSAFPVSISLPFDGAFTEDASHSFFANLLPEGHVREQICKSLKISITNDFALLMAIGGDCAGALSITDSAESLPSTFEDEYELVSEQQLANWSLGAPDAFSAVTGHGSIRLSLAGAQDKLPVHMHQDAIWLPTGNAPSTYILKFASRFYSHLPENETFIALLGRNVGLPVVDVKLRPTAKSTVAMIRRYDRATVDDRIVRLHQEDFCQALGINASQKYEKEGGPSIHQCVQIIRRHSSYPLVDLQHLLRWVFFNLCAGNADAHGKNLSLLYDEKASPRLAPFYDLICTRNYKRISRETAMRIGGESDPDLVTTKHLEGLANDFDIRPKLVLDQFRQFTELVESALPVTIQQYLELHGSSPVLERLPITIKKIIRRLRGRAA